MGRDAVILKYSLLSGAAYFFCIAVAHFFGIKVPGLFIYYNIPSLQYQDNIIAFLAFGWAVFFYNSAKYPVLTGSAVQSALVAILGLVYINLTTDFAVLAHDVVTTPFWVQVGLLAGYVLWLMTFCQRVRASNPGTNYQEIR